MTSCVVFVNPAMLLAPPPHTPSERELTLVEIGCQPIPNTLEAQYEELM